MELSDNFDPPLMCLLNLSNHPVSDWAPEQVRAAVERFTCIVDHPFPAVDPAWDADHIARVADAIVMDIRVINPAAVHLMGEMTLTFTLVARLQSTGFPCLVSTSDRRVEDGRRVFSFAGFRPYPILCNDR
jgi:hypothetical protein